MSKKIFIMPMAGDGVRFKDKGYLKPKPLINVGKSLMFIEAAKSFGLNQNWVFITRLNKSKKEIENIVKNKTKNSKIIYLKKKTKGQADTIFKAKKFIKYNSTNIYINSCDLFFEYDKRELNSKIKKYDLIVFINKPNKINLNNTNKYGWIKILNGKVIKSSCKKKVSNIPNKDWIIIGSFVFKNRFVFNLVLTKLFKQNYKINNEFYLDTTIEIALKLGLKVGYIKVSKYKSWGTPKELNYFKNDSL